MIRSFLTAGLVAVLGLTVVGTAQAQHGRPSLGPTLHYNPPSQYLHVQPPVIATPQLIDCSPQLGFLGRMSRQGLLVTRVTPGTEAHSIGLVPGDIILRADRIRLTCEHDWQQALQRAGRTMNLQVQRSSGRTQTLQARLRMTPPPVMVQPPQFHYRDYPQTLPAPAPLPPRGHGPYGAFGPQQNSTSYHVTLTNNGINLGIRINN